MKTSIPKSKRPIASTPCRPLPQQRAGATIISGPWPTYSAFRDLPERERWVLYGSAKAYREALERQGFEMAEPYDQFIQRVTAELEI